MPAVSVIIPNYNHTEYLKQRIDSVLNQTFTDFEVIILDDCSTDNSKSIIEQYRANEKVSCIVYNDVNTNNPFQQWHKGITLAKGEIIWIAESDDWCEANLLETLVAGLTQKDDCVISYCQSYCVFNDGRIKFQSNHTTLGEYIDGKKFIKQYILPRNPIFNAGMAIWKKSAYSKILKDYINYKLIGDYCFWIELSSCGSVFISGKLLNYFRAHENNTSTIALKNGLVYAEQIPLLKHLLDKNVIDKNDYLNALKKSYYLFRSFKNNIPKANATSIKNMFLKYSQAKYRLQFYFFQKYFQSASKKLLRL